MPDPTTINRSALAVSQRLQLPDLYKNSQDKNTQDNQTPGTVTVSVSSDTEKSRVLLQKFLEAAAITLKQFKQTTDVGENGGKGAPPSKTGLEQQPGNPNSVSDAPAYIVLQQDGVKVITNPQAGDKSQVTGSNVDGPQPPPRKQNPYERAMELIAQAITDVMAGADPVAVAKLTFQKFDTEMKAHSEKYDAAIAKVWGDGLSSAVSMFAGAGGLFMTGMANRGSGKGKGKGGADENEEPGAPGRKGTRTTAEAGTGTQKNPQEIQADRQTRAKDQIEKSREKRTKDRKDLQQQDQEAVNEGDRQRRKRSLENKDETKRDAATQNADGAPPPAKEPKMGPDLDSYHALHNGFAGIIKAGGEGIAANYNNAGDVKQSYADLFASLAQQTDQRMQAIYKLLETLAQIQADFIQKPAETTASMAAAH